MRTVFDAEGNKVRVPEDTPVNDLTRAPRFMDELPEGLLFVPIIVSSKDGTPMVGLANPTLIATTEEVTNKVVEAVNIARQEFVDAGIERDEVQQIQIDRIDTMQQSMNSLLVQVAAKKSVVPLPDVTVAASALITLTAGERTFTQACSGIKTADSVIVSPKSLPVGYGLRGWNIPADNQIAIRVQCPVLSVGGTAIAFAVTAFR